MTHAAAPTTPETPSFELFKTTAILIGQAAQDAEDWRDITIHLENAFTHPLYEATDTREGFAAALAETLASGIALALE